MHRMLKLAGFGRAIAVAVVSLALCPAILLSQQIIENPEKPLAKNAGRVLELKEILRITDESGEFYFKYPTQLQVAGDGSIFLVEPEGEFLHFTQDGKFIKNLYKKGEGPGEISRTFSYFIRGQELIIFDSNKRKIWSTDYDGTLLREYAIPNTGAFGFLGIRNNDFVFSKSVYPAAEERKGLIDIPYSVYLTSIDGKAERQVFTFYFKLFMTQRAGRSWAPSIAVLGPDKQVIVGSFHTEYTIQVVDIEKGQVIRAFNRDYPRVKHKADQSERDFSQRTGAPPMDFEPDVRGLKLADDRIWVRTSTTDPKKGDLWDVFSMDGKFLDCVYLGPERAVLRIDPDAIFVTEKNPDETIAVVKYKIVG